MRKSSRLPSLRVTIDRIGTQIPQNRSFEKKNTVKPNLSATMLKEDLKEVQSATFLQRGRSSKERSPTAAVENPRRFVNYEYPKLQKYERYMDDQEIKLKTWVPTTSYETACEQVQAYIDYFSKVKSSFSCTHFDRAHSGISKSFETLKLAVTELQKEQQNVNLNEKFSIGRNGAIIEFKTPVENRGIQTIPLDQLDPVGRQEIDEDFTELREFLKMEGTLLKAGSQHESAAFGALIQIYDKMSNRSQKKIDEVNLEGIDYDADMFADDLRHSLNSMHTNTLRKQTEMKYASQRVKKVQTEAPYISEHQFEILTQKLYVATSRYHEYQGICDKLRKELCEEKNNLKVAVATGVDHTRTLADLRHQVQMLSIQVKNYQDAEFQKELRYKQMQQELSQQTKKLEENEQKMKAAKAQVSEMKSERAKQKEELAKLNEDVKAAEKLSKKMGKQAKKASQQVNDLESEHQQSMQKAIDDAIRQQQDSAGRNPNNSSRRGNGKHNGNNGKGKNGRRSNTFSEYDSDEYEFGGGKRGGRNARNQSDGKEGETLLGYKRVDGQRGKPTAGSMLDPKHNSRRGGGKKNGAETDRATSQDSQQLSGLSPRDRLTKTARNGNRTGRRSRDGDQHILDSLNNADSTNQTQWNTPTNMNYSGGNWGDYDSNDEEQKKARMAGQYSKGRIQPGAHLAERDWSKREPRTATKERFFSVPAEIWIGHDGRWGANCKHLRRAMEFKKTGSLRSELKMKKLNVAYFEKDIPLDLPN